MFGPKRYPFTKSRTLLVIVPDILTIQTERGVLPSDALLAHVLRGRCVGRGGSEALRRGAAVRARRLRSAGVRRGRRCHCAD